MLIECHGLGMKLELRACRSRSQDDEAFRAADLHLRNSVPIVATKQIKIAGENYVPNDGLEKNSVNASVSFLKDVETVFQSGASVAIRAIVVGSLGTHA